MSRTHLLTGLAVLVAGVVGWSQRGGAEPVPATPPPIRMQEERRAEQVLVHVAGEVRRPGVYRLKDGMRIDDAVRLAGGPTRRADLGAVNLAAKIEDGRQVLVPRRARTGGAARAGAAGTGAGAGGAPDAAGAGGGAPLNLNTATLEQLDTLDGVGPATAQKILDFREERGGFGSVEELGEIPGIGEKRLAALREAVTV